MIMPELPEVERIRRIIEPQIKGRIIRSLIINREDIISHPEADEFSKSVVNQKIENMSRRGKFLTINLSNEDKIILHLRMTGQLLVTLPDFPLEKHTHLIFLLDNQKELRYIDPRRFGRFWLIHKNEEDTYSGIYKLGIEPFDKKLTANYLKEKLSKKNKAIKECLLDQSIVTGIGNIYADEILFDTFIHPKRKASSLSDKEFEALASSIPKILHSAIEDYHLTPEEYLAGKGKKYGNSELIKIYGHENQPCPRCDTPLSKTTISGRSSTFCPHCQK